MSSSAMNLPEPCCPCPTSAHGKEGRGIPGAKCTIPGCLCPGYRLREKKRGPSPHAARVHELMREGLDSATIRERLGVSWSTLQHARTGRPRKSRPGEYRRRRAREAQRRRAGAKAKGRTR